MLSPRRGRLTGHCRTNGRHITPVLVSNDAVGRFRLLRKFLFAVALSLCAVLFLILLASQVEQHVFRRRAELLLSQVQPLELRKTTWQDVQSCSVAGALQPNRGLFPYPPVLSHGSTKTM